MAAEDARSLPIFTSVSSSPEGEDDFSLEVKPLLVLLPNVKEGGMDSGDPDEETAVCFGAEVLVLSGDLGSATKESRRLLDRTGLYLSNFFICGWALTLSRSRCCSRGMD